jgi:sugar phosphate isomerase/epimerase
MLHRRDFIKRAALASGLLLPNFDLLADAFKGTISKVGIQLFSIPKLVEKDFAGTMKMLAQIGYKEIEFYGPYSFSDQEDKTRWESITPSLGFSGSGFYGMTTKEVKKILDDNGLSAPSIHTGLNSLHSAKAMDQTAEAAHILGTKYIVLPSAQTQPTLDAYKVQADDFNKIGAEAKKRGIRFAYHNHGNGLKPLEGKVPLDLIIESTDPKAVFFQMDIYWMTAGGVDVGAYLDKYPGRLKDMSEAVRFSGDGGDSQQWIALFPYLANAGSGVLDLPSILSHAKRSGVEHFIVERDLAPDPNNDLKKSFDYISSVKLK